MKATKTMLMTALIATTLSACVSTSDTKAFVNVGIGYAFHEADLTNLSDATEVDPLKNSPYKARGALGLKTRVKEYGLMFRYGAAHYSQYFVGGLGESGHDREYYNTQIFLDLEKEFDLCFFWGK